MGSAPVTDMLAARRLFLAAAGGVTLWLLATWLWHFSFGHGRQLTHILFLDQDFPALLIAIGGLILALPFLGGSAPLRLPPASARIVLPLILVAMLWSWAGHYLIFQDYALSRDEEVAEFASAYLRDGLLARPIPPQWVEFRRAIMPEFFSPYGANHDWGAAYLPINSLIRGLCWRLGDPNIAGPLLLGVGLFALWRVALRLFPDRPDAVWVTIGLALSSAQLSVTAMTPYAMTGHFALNMVWLALFLRGGRLGHGGAAIVALIAGGLHQWHFPPLFIGPFLLWLLLQRRWALLAFHAAVLGALVLIWAKLWPAFLLHEFGPPADVRPAAGVADKVGSLFARLEKWQPLFNLSRLLAWNGILLLPLALIGAMTMGWRNALAGRTVTLPLALGCLLALGLALAQGYGWGYRYGHGHLGALALLAGFGWTRFSRDAVRPVLAGFAITLVTATFLVFQTQSYVAPYAASDRLIHDARADVVLVDPRGGLFVTDLVRSEHGDMQGPMVLNMGMLSGEDIENLCDRYRVALFDRDAFLDLGVHRARWLPDDIDALRNMMRARDCGETLEPGEPVDGEGNRP